jgi:hypothetical protein
MTMEACRPHRHRPGMAAFGDTTVAVLTPPTYPGQHDDAARINRDTPVLAGELVERVWISLTLRA